MATEGASRVTPFPAGAPAFLRRHPALLVEWLRLVNLLSRWRRERGRTALLVPVSMAVALLLTASRWGRAAGIVEILQQYWLMVGAISAICSFTTVQRRRRHLEQSQAQSWLIAAPIPPSSLRVSHAIRTLLPLSVMFLTLAAFVSGISLPIAGPDGILAAGAVVAALGGGLLAGGAAGWWLAGRAITRPSTAAVLSRYVPRLPATDSLRPDATALGHWPIAQVLASSRPENSRYVLIVALFAVQGGSSTITGLSVVALYFVTSYLGALLCSMLTVSKLAATWLRSTPMTLGTFVLLLSRRAFAHQLLGTGLAITGMLLLGVPLGTALSIAGLWLGLVASICGIALVDNYRGRPPAVRIVLSLAAFAALAALLQLRAGART